MKHWTRITAIVLIMSPLLNAAATSSAGVLFVAGSPEYDETTGDGFKDGQIAYPGSGVNNSGMAVGYACRCEGGTEKGNRAVRWDGSGTAGVELGNLGTASDGVTYTGAHAINDTGMAVGHAWKYVDGVDKGSRAVRWNTGDTIATELGGLGTTASGFAFAVAHAINNDGTAVGTAFSYIDGVSQGSRAVRWDAEATVATELGNLGTGSSGYTEATADAVNNIGTAVGHVDKSVDGVSKGDRAVRWDAGTTIATELGNLGNDSKGVTYAYARAVNDIGTVVGHARKYVDSNNKGDRAVRWEAGSTIATELDNLGTASSGYTVAQAYSITNTGTAVGFAREYVDGANKGNRAVRWDAGTTIATELGNLGTDSNGVADAQAYDANEAGTVVGYAQKYVDGVDTGSRGPVRNLVSASRNGYSV